MPHVGRLASALAAGALIATCLSTPQLGAIVNPARDGTFDPGCNHGRGVQLTEPDRADLDWMTAVHLDDGVTLIEIEEQSDSLDAYSAVILKAVRADCTVDTAFGDRGTLTLQPPKRIGAIFDVQMVPAANGSVLLFGLAGVHSWGWAGTELSATGSSEKSFGTKGWILHTVTGVPKNDAMLPSLQTATRLADGDVLVGGTIGPRCCRVNQLYELDARGEPVASFGANGRAAVLPAFATIKQVVATRRGGIVVAAALRSGTQVLDVFDRDGRPEPAVDANLRTALSSLHGHSSIGYWAYPDPEGGVGIVGSGSDNDFRNAKGAFVFSELLTTRGTLVHGNARGYVPERPFVDQEWIGTTSSRGGAVAAAYDVRNGDLILRDFQASGALNLGFGRSGALAVAPGFSAPDGEDWISSLVITGPRSDVGIVLAEAQGPRLLEAVG